MDTEITYAQFLEVKAETTAWGLESGLRKLGISVGPCALTPAEEGQEARRLYDKAVADREASA